MFNRTQSCSAATLMACVGILSACTAALPTVIEEMDETTAASVTYSQTSIGLSPDAIFDRENTRPYVDLGVIRINRNRIRRYFIWLGIWDINFAADMDQQPKEFESIVLLMDGEELPLDVLSWNHEMIGTSKRIYKKIFPQAVDAYYQVTLEQMQLLAGAQVVGVRTTGPQPREFVPWYREEKAKADLAEFIRRVSP